MHLFQENALPDPTVLVLGLHRYEDQLWLPRVHSVLRDRDGRLSFPQKVVTLRTAASFGYHAGGWELELVRRVDALSVQSLEKRFVPPRRGNWALPKLLEQADLKARIRKYVDTELARLLDFLREKNIPLALEPERRTRVADVLLPFAERMPTPRFRFERTATGIDYELSLVAPDGSVWRPNDHQIEVLTGEPAWIILNGLVGRMAHFNGRMLLPFARKNTVQVPEEHLGTYFKKFILKVAKRHPIEAEGFEVLVQNELVQTLLEVTQRLGERDFELAVRFRYPQVTFAAADPKRERVTLDLGEDGTVVLYRTQRNEAAENERLEKLTELGFQRQASSYFTTKRAAELPQLLAQRNAELTAAGFTVLPMAFNGRTVYLHPASYRLSVLTGNDWFDVFGTVTVGEFSFPFLKLAENFRSGNRFFLLPKGEFFLIPEAWMSKFSGLLQFGQPRESAVRVARSQYALLKNLHLDLDELPDAHSTDDLAPPAELRATLRPYQLTGYRWLAQHCLNGLGACLADDMGLGKTLQTIAALLFAHREAPAAAETSELDLFQERAATPTSLVVLPASLVFNWREELKKFAPHLKVCTYTGPRRPRDLRALRTFDVLLSTYQTVLRDVELLAQLAFTYVVLDESQQIKNREGKTFRAVTQLNAAHRVSLSGTPIENSLSDLWAQMQFINPGLLKGYAFFKREYITPIERHRDEHRIGELREVVQPYLLRRTKEEVAPDLPELTEDVRYAEMTPAQRKLYEAEKSRARNYLLENFQDKPQYRFQVLQSLLKLRQLAISPLLLKDPERAAPGAKLADLQSKIDEVRRAGHKVLVFSFFVEVLKLIRAGLDDAAIPYVELTGQTAAAARERNVRRFQEEADVSVFLISTKAGGAGLNLTAADYVFIVDPWWNPAVEQQAIARAHRIGRERPVFVQRFITKDTIEEKILLLQERKAILASDIIGAEGPVGFARGDIEFLFG